MFDPAMHSWFSDLVWFTHRPVIYRLSTTVLRPELWTRFWLGIFWPGCCLVYTSSEYKPYKCAVPRYCDLDVWSSYILMIYKLGCRLVYTSSDYKPFMYNWAVPRYCDPDVWSSYWWFTNLAVVSFTYHVIINLQCITVLWPDTVIQVCDPALYWWFTKLALVWFTHRLIKIPMSITVLCPDTVIQMCDPAMYSWFSDLAVVWFTNRLIRSLLRTVLCPDIVVQLYIPDSVTSLDVIWFTHLLVIKPLTITVLCPELYLEFNSVFSDLADAWSTDHLVINPPNYNCALYGALILFFLLFFHFFHFFI